MLAQSLAVGALCLCSLMGSFSLEPLIENASPTATSFDYPESGVAPIDVSEARYFPSLFTVSTWSQDATTTYSPYNNSATIRFSNPSSSDTVLFLDCVTFDPDGDYENKWWFCFSSSFVPYDDTASAFIALLDVTNGLDTAVKLFQSDLHISSSLWFYAFPLTLSNTYTHSAPLLTAIIYSNKCSQSTSGGLSLLNYKSNVDFDFAQWYYGYRRGLVSPWGDGYTNGYDAGYTAGETEASGTYAGIGNLIPNVFGSVVGFISQIASIEVFGIKLADILGIVAGGGLIALIVKLFLK